MYKKILPLMLFSALANAQVLETVTPQKGYILSVDLKNKECTDIWKQHIPIFKENNPKIKDPNVLSIGKDILVQNCATKQVLAEEKKEEKAPIKNECKKDKSRTPFFVAVSGVLHGAEQKNNDRKKETTGYKIELGKYFKVNNDELKLSLGFLRTKSKYDVASLKDIEFERGFFSFDSSYLMKVGEKIKIGPQLGLLYSPLGTQFKDPAKSENHASALAGVNAVYDLSKNFAIDFKLNNQLENRFNVMSTLGIEYKF